MSEIGRRIEKPTVANLVDGGRTPLLSTGALADLGFSLAIFPVTGFLAAAHALRQVYEDIRTRGAVGADAPLYPFEQFNELIGFPDVWAFERRFPEAD